MHSNVLLLALPILLSTISAKPLSMTPRGQQHGTLWVKGNDEFIDFAPGWPTCQNDQTLQYINSSFTPDVTVQPDCDNAIDLVCRAANKQGNSGGFLYDMTSTIGTCQAHIVLTDYDGHVSVPSGFTYDSCVQSFQQITTQCMLLDPKGKYASKGQQAGVLNTYYKTGGTNGAWYWSSDGTGSATPSPGAVVGPQPAGVPDQTRRWTTKNTAGYMVGPEGQFGDVFGCDASKILNSGVCV